MARPHPSVLTKLPLESVKVLPEFADALRQAASAAEMTVEEYCIWAAGEKIMRAGRALSGVFETDDLAWVRS